jgi:hypothetical protein
MLRPTDQAGAARWLYQLIDTFRLADGVVWQLACWRRYRFIEPLQYI